MTATNKDQYKAIAFAGLVAGTLDLTAALVTNVARGGTPSRIIQAIASGLLGRNAFAGGAKTVALGVFLHFVIAFGATVVFYALSRVFSFLNTHSIIAGLLYGIAVYFFMNLVVLPLSAVPFNVSFRPALLITGLVVHMLCVGLPISIVINRYAPGRG